MTEAIETLLETLRCPNCRAGLTLSGETLHCHQCNISYPITNGIPRLLLPSMRDALTGEGHANAADATQADTAHSFGYEWHRFPEMYEEWEKQFLNYMQPHAADFFPGKKILDAGCGNGRFAYYAAKYGAEVWAIDLGPAVEVARRNTQSRNVHVVQADLHNPPFALESFDFIYSFGVLHHLPNPEAAFQNLLRFLKPGGVVQIYLYWKPEQRPIKAAMLSGITAARRLTTRLPHGAVYALAYPTAMAAFTFFVWPYRILRRVPLFNRVAEEIPLKQYANLPFRVCVNDQLDRFSAPIENRYTRQDVHNWLARASLEAPSVGENFGWIASGRKAQ
ncbi:MAG TPA: methyltransferase domain-containing protein [Pyrinomonadaceae bacterium]|nr:methyltransferase domain-containing protein [Pyrinomonadaceae bacterium]